MRKDWTQDKDGRANSSELFQGLVGEVDRLIKDSSHDLIAGQTRSVAGLILAQLAHKHGLSPAIERPAMEFAMGYCLDQHIIRVVVKDIKDHGDIQQAIREYGHG